MMLKYSSSCANAALEPADNFKKRNTGTSQSRSGSVPPLPFLYRSDAACENKENSNSSSNVHHQWNSSCCVDHNNNNYNRTTTHTSTTAAKGGPEVDPWLITQLLSTTVPSIFHPTVINQHTNSTLTSRNCIGKEEEEGDYQTVVDDHEWNEPLLLHGTTVATAALIAAEGFDDRVNASAEEHFSVNTAATSPTTSSRGRRVGATTPTRSSTPSRPSAHGTTPPPASPSSSSSFSSTVTSASGATTGTGNLFGLGTYLTNTICKAHMYSKPVVGNSDRSSLPVEAVQLLRSVGLAHSSSSGSTTTGAGVGRVLVVAKALLGHPCVISEPARGLRRPPVKPTGLLTNNTQHYSNNSNSISERYDSVIGNGKQHKEFVLYDRGQVLPVAVIGYVTDR